MKTFIRKITARLSLLLALSIKTKNINISSRATRRNSSFFFLFDGSKSVSMLNETLDFERKMNLESKPLHFTYFINAAYFLAPENAHFYQAPGQAPGVSKIGFSENAATIAARVGAFNVAEKEGNEIGSHSAGHFDGGSWSYDYWKQEFNSFNDILSNVQKYNPSVVIPAPQFSGSTIVGFSSATFRQ